VAVPSNELHWVAETSFGGIIARFHLRRRDVEPLLPPDVCLEPRSARSDRIPVLVALGDHTAPVVHMSGLRVHTGVSFREVFFGVRCRRRAAPGAALFVPWMYCDESVSTWTGNALYGFNKQAASMEWLGDSFVVTQSGTMVLQALAEVSGSRCESVSRWNLPAGLAVVGRRRDGSQATCRFAWDWSRASTERARVALVPGVGAPDPLAAAPIFSRNAVRVRNLIWRISWPSACHSLREKRHLQSRPVMDQLANVYPVR
jgi:hypothetical protein